tara:strand:+ start:348 stop:950 length:603 start_codon:yes stop_codon:yes gene_type:complete
MNKFLFVLLCFSVFTKFYSQKIRSVDEFDIVSATKKTYAYYENLFEVKKLITSFGTFQKGDKLLINRPQNGNLLRFSWIAIGKYSLLNAMAMIMYPSSNINTQIVIDCLRIYKPLRGKSAAIIVDFKINNDLNPDEINTFGNIFNFERAIDTGEILNQNTTLNKYQAINKLKEATELLKLDRISKEEFDDLKEKLSIIMN